ncbi:hypothetical protein BDR26DRAFT_865306 [Obelidium mucronatum]|nr:hypothetical protein BDR26DRAFT_865306 [Obelidium mucronatum]
MVSCLRVFLFIAVSPLPTAPSFFLAVLLLSMVIEHTPCPYCSLLVLLLLKSSCALMGSGDDYSGFGESTCWIDSRFLFASKLAGMVWRDNMTDAVSRGLVPDVVLHHPPVL